MNEELFDEILKKAAREDLYHRILKESLDGGTPVVLYANPRDLEAWTFGYVQRVGDHTVSLQQLDADGEFEGTVSLRIGDIVVIMQDTRFERRARLLQEHLGTVIDANAEAEDLDEREVFLEELRSAKASGDVVNCRVSSDRDSQEVVGFVAEVTGDFAQIRMLTPDGEPNGLATLRLEDISRISRNEKYLNHLQILYERRKELYFDGY